MFAALAAVAALAVPAHSPPPLNQACAKTATSLILTYVKAYDKGQVGVLDRLFAPAGLFQQYAFPAPGRRAGAAARDRATLRAYFARRHRAGDRARIRVIQMDRASARLSRFQLELDRRAPGYRRGRWTRLRGSGEIRCDRRRITLLKIRVK